jgi:hypothetical protein
LPDHITCGAQLLALGREISDEFTVPLCRGHHREVHRCGDEAGWWKKMVLLRAWRPRRLLTLLATRAHAREKSLKNLSQIDCYRRALPTSRNT